MKCPNPHCDNNGTFADHASNCDGDCKFCPQPYQCEWCYGNQESDFNIRINQQVSEAGKEFIREMQSGEQIQ